MKSSSNSLSHARQGFPSVWLCALAMFLPSSSAMLRFESCLLWYATRGKMYASVCYSKKYMQMSVVLEKAQHRRNTVVFLNAFDCSIIIFQISDLKNLHEEEKIRLLREADAELSSRMKENEKQQVSILSFTD